MRSSSTQSVIIFVIVCTLLILLLITFITVIVYRYQQRQNAYNKDLENLKSLHKTEILQSQLEMQEQTFQNISQEIHDNIGQKLTLAKLHLNTLNLANTELGLSQVKNVISIIGESIADLSDISRSMSSEIILNNGLIKALEFEVIQLSKAGLYNIKLSITGDEVFLDGNKELLLFRIVQESLNNIVKHAEASQIHIGLHFSSRSLGLEITDNGKGFNNDESLKRGAGLINITKRASILHGDCVITSALKKGTNLKIEIPLYEQEQAV